MTFNVRAPTVLHVGLMNRSKNVIHDVSDVFER